MIRTSRLLIFIVGFLVSGSSEPAESLNGLWRSQGYGYVFEIQGSSLKNFEVTTTTCVPGVTARRDQAELPGRAITFNAKDGDVLLIKAGGSSDHKLLHSEGAASDIRIERLPKMPDVCRHLTRNTPLDNFEVFTRTWAEHYISFDLKHAWERIVAESRHRVTSRTTPAELFEIFQERVKPFGDAHTFINAPNLKRRLHGIRPGSDRAAKDGLDAFQQKGMQELLA